MLNELQNEHLRKYALVTATKSKCTKRKVGAVITSENGLVLSSGWNHTLDDSPCENADGNTYSHVVHAEAAAVLKLEDKFPDKRIKGYIFVTHLPCESCQNCINNHDLEVILVPDFMKFDNQKQRYDLLPMSVVNMAADSQLMPYFLMAFKSAEPSFALHALAKFICYEAGVSPDRIYEVLQAVLEYGAKKYKPENWRLVESLTRYWNALGRHVSAMDRGILVDEESNLPHAHHALCNIAFLLELIPRPNQA